MFHSALPSLHCGSLISFQLTYPQALYRREKKKKETKKLGQIEDFFFLVRGILVPPPRLSLSAASQSIFTVIILSYLPGFWSFWPWGWGGFYGLIPHKASNNLSVHPQPNPLPPPSFSPTTPIQVPLTIHEDTRMRKKGRGPKESRVGVMPGSRHTHANWTVNLFHFFISYRKWTDIVPQRTVTTESTSLNEDSAWCPFSACGLVKW